MKPETAYVIVEEWGGWTLQMSIHRTTGLCHLPTEPGVFRFSWVVDGTSLIILNGITTPIEGPALLCLGSRDTVVPLQDQAEVRTILFHPGALNDAFLEHDVYDLNHFKGTTLADQYYLHPFLHVSGNAAGPLTLPLVVIDRLQFLFDRIEGEIRDRVDDFWPCRARSHLLEALILTRHGFAPTAQSEFVDRLLVHLHTHYAQPLTLPELAVKFATNRTTLAARFRQKTGQSVGDYLRQHRIRVAEVLLRDTDIPIAEILERVGFSDPSQFGRLFRRQTKLSPSEYRNRHNWMLRNAS